MKIKRILSCFTTAVMLLAIAASTPFIASSETAEIFRDDFESGFGG